MEVKSNKHFFAAFIAFFIWGFFTLALKQLDQFSSLDILFYRVFVCVFLMTLINLIFRRKSFKSNLNTFKELAPKTKIKVVRLTLIGGLLLTANWFIFIYVVNKVNIQSASLAYLICPILTTVFAFFILKEKPTNWQWFAILISAISCIIIGFNHLRDVAFSIVVASTYALYLISQRRNNELDKFLSLTIQLILVTLILIPFYPKLSGSLPTDFHFYKYIVLIAIFFTIIPLFLNLYALKGISSATVGILMYINPIMNFMIAFFVYGEHVTPLQLFAYCLILLSILIFNQKIVFSRQSYPRLSKKI